MKKLTLLVISGLLVINCFSQNPVSVKRLNIQQLQKIKIVPVAKTNEQGLVSKMNDLETHMNDLQARQLQLQKDLDALLNQQAELKSKLDGMNELSETSALRLQMMMDRRAKFMEALSNMLKKMSSTSQSITDNLK